MLMLKFESRILVSDCPTDEGVQADMCLNAEIKKPDTYVDTLQMLDTFSKDMIYVELPAPLVKTLFIDFVKFVPGQPDYASSSTPLMSRQNMGPLPSGGFGGRPEMLDPRHRHGGNYYPRLDGPSISPWEGPMTRPWAEQMPPHVPGYYGSPAPAPRAIYLPNTAGPFASPSYTPSPHGWSSMQEQSVSAHDPRLAATQPHKRKNPDDLPPASADGPSHLSKRHATDLPRTTQGRSPAPSLEERRMPPDSRPDSRTSSTSRSASSMDERRDVGLHRQVINNWTPSGRMPVRDPRMNSMYAFLPRCFYATLAHAVLYRSPAPSR
jgi:histone demethylase JARID1